ncbi:SLAM family member 5-like [Hyperolius riggenbachi]|uniref:SLAM family member 5-like n=1 Tax=Hyperolius riggenbachi TaxID=752182 RepID=UPI0035A2CFE9
MRCQDPEPEGEDHAGRSRFTSYMCIRDFSKESGLRSMGPNQSFNEEIASLRIDISHSPQNDSCVVTMNCVLQGGNYVTFSWTRDQEDLHHNSSILVIPVTRQNANSTFSCKAQNPVSSNWSRITLQQHCKPIAEPYINNNIIIYIATCSTIALLLVATLIIGILSRRYCIAKGKSIMQTTDQQQRQPHPVSQPVTLPVAEFGQHVHTVYAKVHKKESLDNIPNTVYALAGPMKAEP